MVPKIARMLLMSVQPKVRLQTHARNCCQYCGSLSSSIWTSAMRQAPIFYPP